MNAWLPTEVGKTCCPSFRTFSSVEHPLNASAGITVFLILISVNATQSLNAAAPSSRNSIAPLIVVKAEQPLNELAPTNRPSLTVTVVNRL